jgi:RNA polymerase sigma-54 factor
MFQLQIHNLRPLATAHLAQTMTLLTLNTEELRQQIDSELAANPALEMVDERRCPQCARILPRSGACPICSRPKTNYSDSPKEDLTCSTENLPAYVLHQIAPELDLQSRSIAAYLLTHLDEDGLLSIPLIEIARYMHVPLSKVEYVQSIIQHAEPLGVGSSSPQQALQVQMEILEETRRIPELAKRIIHEGLDLFIHRHFVELARQLHTSQAQVQQVVRFISENLNPYPARSFWGDVRQPAAAPSQVYHRPDIIISFLNEDPNNPLVVEIIMPIQGTLRVNPLFRTAVREATDEKKVEWKNDLERASLFVKCLQQRNHTMQRLLSRVASMQKDFIINGDKHLKPVTRAFISRELDVHESTISRAVAGKTIQLPNRRIVPFSSFFDRSLNVRTILRDFIDQEPHPLSDSELAVLLSREGINVARRTVAKYRAMEGILPAHLRNPLLKPV